MRRSVEAAEGTGLSVPEDTHGAAAKGRRLPPHFAYMCVTLLQPDVVTASHTLAGNGAAIFLVMFGSKVWTEGREGDRLCVLGLSVVMFDSFFD